MTTTKTAPAGPRITLPTKKSAPTLDPSRAKILLYGEQGIGKTTLASRIEPDSTLILATEPGTGGIEAYVQRILSWEEFRSVANELATTEHHFSTVVIDTVDELHRMCQDAVMSQHKIAHPSDLEWGKGWGFVADEWKLKIGRLCNLGLGVIFTSHAVGEEYDKSFGKGVRMSPSLNNKNGQWLMGFVDYVLYATTLSDADGRDMRVLRGQPSPAWKAKTRGLPEDERRPLPDWLPMEPGALRDYMRWAMTPAKNSKETDK